MGWVQVEERPHVCSFPEPEEWKINGKWPWFGSIWECSCGDRFELRLIDNEPFNSDKLRAFHTERYFGHEVGFFRLDDRTDI